MKTILAFIIGFLALDVLGFMLWLISGQVPMDSFYVGTITAHLLAIIF